MQLAEANRLYDEAHEGLFHDGNFKVWLPKRTVFTPYGAREGVSIWLSAVDYSPDEDLLRRPEVGSYVESADVE